MRRRIIAIMVLTAVLPALVAGCTKTEAPPSPTATAAPAVTLKVAGGWADFRALDVSAKAFTELYPNCTIEYEYLQDHRTSLVKRLEGDDPVDLFVTTNIQEGSELLPYALNLRAHEGQDGIDLSNTFEGLIQNFAIRTDDKQLYAVPLGAEMRGMYVNKTLLESLGLSVPTNQESLLAACEVLKENGYIPFHGNPGSFPHLLIYPWICNLIANAEDPQAAYAKVNSREPGISDMLREPLEFLYMLVEKDYYDYKRAQTELDIFNGTADEDYARYLLNIQNKDGELVKVDDVGLVAFMPATMSQESVIDRMKEDYHSAIEYEFIPAPVSDTGGFAYMSPAHGIAICKNSKNIDWAVKFLNFLFIPENNEAFAKAFNVIPNTKEAFAYVRERFDLPESSISELGQVTFDYGFYELLLPFIVDLSKANNPKYMNDDGAGNLTLYPLTHYTDPLEAAFAENQ